jgi:hypothetical protein
MHMDQSEPGRNVLRQQISPRERARACLLIHTLVVLESDLYATARRNVLARLAIGLPPVPRRTVDLERCQ